VIRVLIAVIPFAFVLGSWLWADGVPYYTDANETFASYVHARNMVTWDPRQTAWLTSEVTDPTYTRAANLYAHNPNGPRYVHYLLLLVGLTDLRLHILIVTAAGALATSYLVWRFWQSAAYCQSALWGVVPLALFLDPIGCLYWLANTYRLWTFALYFACLWAVAARRPVWVGLTAFLLLQYEYGTGLFIGVTLAVFAVLFHGRRSLPLLAAAMAGAACSLGLFGYQVWSVFGTDGLLADLIGTALRRGGGGAAPTGAMLADHLWRGPALLLYQVGTNSHSWPVTAMLVYGVLSAIPILVLSRCHARRVVAMLALATAAGTIVTSGLLWDYFTQGFVYSSLPLATLLISLGVGSSTLDLYRLGRPHAPLALCAGLLLAPLLHAGGVRVRPPVDPTVYHLLSTEYRGRTLVAVDSLALTVTALTGGPVIPAGGIWVGPEQRERVEASRPPSGEYAYVCIDTNTMRFPGLDDRCGRATDQMLPHGDTIERAGFGWVILRLKP
jgi:hypothetical protein